MRDPTRRAAVSPTSSTDRLHVQDVDGGSGPRARARRRSRHPLGGRGVRRLRGARPVSRVLVVARRRADRRGSRRRASRPHLVHLVAGRSGRAAACRSLSAGGNGQRGRFSRGARVGRIPRRHRLGPRGIPVPRQRDMERSVSAHLARALARPEAVARPRGRPRVGQDADHLRGHRRALADGRDGRAGPAARRQARVRRGIGGHPPDHAGRRARDPAWAPGRHRARRR